MLSSNLLERLEELKKWQQQQQERLLRQQQQIRLETDSSVTSLEVESFVSEIEGIKPLEEGTVSGNNEEVKKIDGYPSSEHNLENTCDIKTTVKRPFLKKGSGLARYKLQNKPILKECKKTQRQNFNKPNKVTFEDNTQTEKPLMLDKPTAQITLKGNWNNRDTQTNSFNREVISKINQFAADRDIKQQTNVQFEHSSEKELLIFEALERKTVNSSFCSTNSSVVRLLSSTPSKPVTSKITDQPNFGSVSDVTDDSELVDRLISEHLTGNNVEDFIRNLQLLRQRNEENHERSGSSVTSEDIEEATLAREYRDSDTWSDCSEKNTEVGLVDANQERESDRVKVLVTTGTNTEFLETAENSAILEDALAQKLKDLDKELNSFRTENVRLEKLKRELQQEKNEFYKEKRKLLKEVEEQRAEMKEFLDSEKQKLAKERMIFERYTKDSQNRPSKQERTELSDLRIELANVKELLKMKESKNGITQARLRNQIKTLEKENSNLKEEIDKLNKYNAKLLANQKIALKATDTKILHEINRNLTKLAKDVMVKGKNDDSDDSDCHRKVNKSKGDALDYLPVSTKEKENDGSGRGTASLEECYGRVFTKPDDSKKNDKIEKILEDGSIETKFPNGNIKTVTPDGNLIKLRYYNGDIKITDLLKGFIKYTYAENGTIHTTFADGKEVLEFSNGQVEKRAKDGSSETTFPDGTVRILSSDGKEEIRYLDGSVVTIGENGERILTLPNGQKEIHTDQHKRREYPDGTVKTLYNDGTQETRYSNGRIRVKDAQGNLILDSHG